MLWSWAVLEFEPDAECWALVRSRLAAVARSMKPREVKVSTPMTPTHSLARSLAHPQRQRRLSAIVERGRGRGREHDANARSLTRSLTQVALWSLARIDYRPGRLVMERVCESTLRR